MADFQAAFLRTMAYEGIYSHDPDDAGGETYKGIARYFNPSWHGWKMIDDLRRKSPADFPAILESVESLQYDVREFYKSRYWDVFRLSEMWNGEGLVNDLFDCAVNLGVTRACSFLQRGLNLLNRNGALYPDLVQDGKFGDKTFKALHALPDADVPVLARMLMVLRGSHYIEYMVKSPAQEKFARGWFNRISKGVRD